MKAFLSLLLLLIVASVVQGRQEKNKGTKFYSASDPRIQYTGRIDFTNPALPRFWAPGVYVQTGFTGTECEILMNDESYGNSHNYISVVVDAGPAQRIKLTDRKNILKVAGNLRDQKHTLLICKTTESNIGYLEFVGIRCAGLFKVPKPDRKIEFIGNSITCGTGSDTSTVRCGQGAWHDQHNAYMSYGPLTARTFNAQWHLTAYSGIGLIHSCCDLKYVMPQIFDKVNMRDDTITWNFKKYQPDVVTVCLGQNDGIQDSTAFCTSYLNFLGKLRSCYPKATLICLTSPMAEERLLQVQKSYIESITEAAHAHGDRKIYRYFFSKRYFHGCDSHPDLSEHQQIAAELSSFIRQIESW